MYRSPPRRHSPTKAPQSPRSILQTKIRPVPYTDSKIYQKKHGRYHQSPKHKLHNYTANSYMSPLREKKSNIMQAPGSLKGKTPNRVVWTRETPMKQTPRNIRRLDSDEKDVLYNNRPDLDPTGGAFNMQAWMDGQDQDEPQYEDSDSEDSALSEEYEDTLMSDEDATPETTEPNVTKSFLSRLQEIASGRA